MRKAERREPLWRAAMASPCHVMSRLAWLFYQAVKQLPVVYLFAERALSHPRKSPFNDPLPHFPFGPVSARLMPPREFVVTLVPRPQPSRLGLSLVGP